MNNKIVYLALYTLVLAVSFPAHAQQAGKVPLIGVLFIGGLNQPHLEAFKQGLRERGYTEGKNIFFF